MLFCIINCSRSFHSVGSSIILNSLWVFRETIRQFSGRQRNFFDCVRTLSERNCCNVAGLSGAVWQGRGGHAPCFMNGLVALGGGREERRGDASGFTLGWIGNVAVSVSAVVVREDIFLLFCL